MNFNSIYIVDYDKLITWLLPTFLRKVKLFRWLQILIEPVKLSYADFLKYREHTIYKLSHNSQVCYLQKILNDAFDNELKRIVIKNGTFLTPLYIYSKPEKRPVYLGQEYLYSKTDFDIPNPDFIICIPIELKPIDTIAFEDYINEVNVLVSIYKLASKTYTIQWID